MKSILGILLSLCLATQAFASDSIITMRHSATFSDKGGHVIVIEFLAEDIDACLDTLTLETNIGTEEISGIGCSMATMGGRMTFFYTEEMPTQIEILKATGVKDGKNIDALGMLVPVNFKPLQIVSKTTTENAPPKSMSQQIDSFLDDAEKLIEILEKYNGRPIATKDELEFVVDMIIKMDSVSQQYPDQYWSPAQLDRFRALATRLNKVPPTW